MTDYRNGGGTTGQGSSGTWRKPLREQFQMGTIGSSDRRCGRTESIGEMSVSREDLSMAIIFKCRQCGKRYKVRDEAAGKRVECKECGQKMRVPTPKETHADDDIPVALDPAAAAESVSGGPNLAPRPAPVVGRKKRKRQKTEPPASASDSVLTRLPQYALAGAVVGAIFFAVFVVIDTFVFSSADYGIVYKQPEANFFVVLIIYGAIGAVFGAIVMGTAGLSDSMAAGLGAGAVVMAVEKGIAMAMVPGAGSGFQVLGLIVGALYGLFFSWAILSSIKD